VVDALVGLEMADDGVDEFVEPPSMTNGS